MKNLNIKYTVLVMLFSIGVLPSAIWAQDDLPTGEVEVVKDFDARLDDSKRLNIEAKLPKHEEFKPNYTYEVTSSPLEVIYDAPTLKPLAMGSERNPTYYNGFLKAGYGLPKSPFGELGYVYNMKAANGKKGRGSKSRGKKGARSAPTSNGQIGIHLLHHAAESKDIDNQRFSDTGGEIYYKKKTKQGFQVGGEFGYQVNNDFLYGYDHDSLSYTLDEARRRFRTYDLTLGLYNGTSKNLDLDYKIEGGAYIMNEDIVTEHNERGFMVNLGVGKWLKNKHKVSLDLETDLSSYEQQLDSLNNKQELNNFSLLPMVELHVKGVKVEVGANIASANGAFNVFPDIEASAQIAGNRFIVFAGADGGLTKNNFRNVMAYNPYVGPKIDSIFNTVERQYYGGIKGNVQMLNYEAKVAFKDLNDMALYNQDPTDSRYFDLQKESGNIITIGGTLNADITSNFNASLSANQNFFDLKSAEKPFHLPSFEANATVRYRALDDHLFLKGELYMQDAVSYLDPSGEVQNLNTLFDVNFGAEYFFTENIGLFLNLNNLAANERQRWNGYPQYGLNVLAGVSARF